MKTPALIISFLLSATVLAADLPLKKSEVCKPFDHNYKDWTKLLKKYVHNGKVDYKTLQEESGREALELVEKSFEAVCKQDHKKFTRDQKLSYWINVYNVYAIEIILRNYPLKSIRKIGWIPYSAFKQDFIPIHYNGDDELDLDDVEKEILIPMGEPRIHFAINCASFSCPKLQSEAFIASKLNKQLMKAAKEFINDETKNKLDLVSKTMFLSKIFDWYKKDFGGSDKAIRNFIKPYWSAKNISKIKAMGLQPKVKYQEYNWALNE